MALANRIIPCLDVDRGRVVKGIRFENIADAGDPVEVAKRYNEEGADEITFLDITASSDERDILPHLVRHVAAEVFIPMTVGGGVRSAEDICRLHRAGADKVAINTAAVKRPDLIKQAADAVGSQCVVVAIDARQREGEAKWNVYTHGGRTPHNLDAVEWAQQAQEYGAGEILLTSMDRDGTKLGFDLALTRRVSESVGIPVIASGGVGELGHLAAGITQGLADAVLAASIFHFREYTIREAKRHMREKGINVRLEAAC